VKPDKSPASLLPRWSSDLVAEALAVVADLGEAEPEGDNPSVFPIDKIKEFYRFTCMVAGAINSHKPYEYQKGSLNTCNIPKVSSAEFLS
jgi:hypothetical protein